MKNILFGLISLIVLVANSGAALELQQSTSGLTQEEKDKIYRSALAQLKEIIEKDNVNALQDFISEHHGKTFRFSSPFQDAKITVVPPIHYCVMKGATGCFKLLLENGEDPGSFMSSIGKVFHQWNCMDLVILLKRFDIGTILVENDPSYIEALLQEEELLKGVINRIKANKKDIRELLDIGLLKAVKDNNINAARFFVESGASMNIRNDEGKTPLIIAKENRNSGMISLLTPNFIPTPVSEEDRKSIVIVGAHPGQDRWKNRWLNLAKQYDLMFIDSGFSGKKTLTDVLNPYGKVQVLKYDFNNDDLGEKLGDKKFDLVICDHSVFKFFRFDSKNPSGPIPSLISFLNPNGYCVLGPLDPLYGGSIGFPSYQNLNPYNNFRTNAIKYEYQYGKYINFFWHIGKTSKDKNNIIEKIEMLGEWKLDAEKKQTLENLVVEMSDKFTPDNAKNSVNSLLNNKGSDIEIKQIQVFDRGDIETQLDQVLPFVSDHQKDAERNWMVISTQESAKK